MKNKKQIHAQFFQTPSGNVPVLDWIKGFGSEDRRIIGKAIQKVEIGGPQIGKPTVDGVGDGLYEIRCVVANGTAEVRLLFAVSGTSLLILHGLIKKTNALTKHDRNLAKQRLAESKRKDQS